MVSKTVTGFLCICSWLHGATIGIAMGDSVEVYRFFTLTCVIVLLISLIWSHSAPMRRMAASLTFLVCSAFLISIGKTTIMSCVYVYVCVYARISRIARIAMQSNRSRGFVLHSWINGQLYQTLVMICSTIPYCHKNECMFHF